MKVAYVNSARSSHESAEALLTDWWSTPATLEAVAGYRSATGPDHVSPVDIEVVFRTKQPFLSIERNAVTYHFAVDDGRFGWRTARRVRHAKPDVVHINGFTHPWRSLVVMLMTRRSAHVVQHHGEAPSRSKRALFAQRWIGRRAAAIAMTGAHEGNAAAFVDARVITQLDRVHEVTETVIQFEPPIARVPLGDNPLMAGAPSVLWVGRNIVDKDVSTAIAAVTQLRLTRPQATLAIVGAGHHDLASTSPSWVRVVGERPRHELPDWYCAADVVLSTSHREGSGYAVLEALTCRARVAVSDLASHRAMVPPPQVRFTPGDPDGAAQAIRAALAGPPVRVPDAAAELLRCYDAARKVADGRCRSWRSPC